MSIDLIAEPIGFLSQAKLGCGLEHAAYAFLAQIFERRLAAPRPRQWDICGKRLRQSREIDTHLRYIAIGLCPCEKFAVTSLDKNVEHGCVEGWIDRVTMCFPAAVKQIYLDAAPNHLTVIYPNCSIAKIRTSFAVPGAELDDINFVSGSADKMFA